MMQMNTVQITAKTDNKTRTSDPLAYTWTVDGTAPEAPALIAPDDLAGGQHPSTSFSWHTATDATSGVDHYDLLIDDAVAATVPASACTDSCSGTPPALTETAHTWQVRAVDKAGNSTSRPFALKFDATPPPIENLSARAGDSTIAVSWRSTADSASVNVMRSPGVGGAPSVCSWWWLAARSRI